MATRQALHINREGAMNVGRQTTDGPAPSRGDDDKDERIVYSPESLVDPTVGAVVGGWVHTREFGFIPDGPIWAHARAL